MLCCVFSGCQFLIAKSDAAYESYENQVKIESRSQRFHHLLASSPPKPRLQVRRKLFRTAPPLRRSQHSIWLHHANARFDASPARNAWRMQRGGCTQRWGRMQRGRHFDHRTNSTHTCWRGDSPAARGIVGCASPTKVTDRASSPPLPRRISRG